MEKNENDYLQKFKKLKNRYLKLGQDHAELLLSFEDMVRLEKK